MHSYSPYLAQTTPHPFYLDVARAEGVFVFDTNGKKYFDLISGVSVSNLGHQNPHVVKAIQAQVEKHLHVMVYGEFGQEPQRALAEKLISLLPARFEQVYLVNSGTEANEGALKLARRHTGRSKIVSFRGAYHGSTMGSLSVSGNEMKKYAFRPLIPDVYHIPFNNLDALEIIDERTAAVIVEPIQGDAGIRIPSIEFMQALRERCDTCGSLLIFDEIQSGMGRTGELFGFMHFGVEPDILTTAKALGGGLPLGAFITSKSIMESLISDPILGHITTFGGNPVSCAAALATLQVISEPAFLEEVNRKGHLIASLLEHPLVKEIRYKGMFFAIEMEMAEQVQKVVGRCLELGVISFWFLSCPESFRIAPPLSINDEEIKEACTLIVQAMDDVK